MVHFNSYTASVIAVSRQPGISGPKRYGMKWSSLTILACMLIGSLWAQAPDGWTRTKEKKEIEAKGKKITQYGEWSSADGTLTAIVVDAGQVKTVKVLGERAAGMMSGVMRSGILPLKFESESKPHPMLIVRGQAVYEGGEYFQDTYAVLTQKGLLMIKVSGLEKELSFDLEKWELGEPINDDDGGFARKMEKLGKDLNGEMAKLQDLVKKVRQESKRP